jgi:site-specific DNA recombinase
MKHKAITTKALGYARVSTQGQVEEGISLDMQDARIRGYCTMRNLELVDIMIDPAISAGKYTLEKREGGMRILSAIQQGHVHHIVALKLDRLFRDAEDALHQTKVWDKAGVSLHLLDLGGATIDTSTAMGRMFLTMMAGFAEMERNLTIERTILALARKRERNEFIGMAPYGWSVGPDGVHLIEHEAEQAVIALVQALRATGLSMRAITSELNRQGLTNRAGGPFVHRQVERILKASA